MQNKYFELCCRSARQHHRNKRGDQFEQGIRVRHDYSEVDPNGLSWWDDVQFIRGGMRVSVTWQHPRNAYQDMIEDAAMKSVHHLYEKIDGGMLHGGERCYTKVGRSRKKISSYVTNVGTVERQWLDALSVEKARLSKEAEFSVVPSSKVEMLRWCRFVQIVAPIEVRNVTELRALADLVRSILNRETTLAREFPGYVYGKAQWVADGLSERPLGIVSHRVAGT